MYKSATFFLILSMGAFAQQSAPNPSDAKTYAARCASCHGADMRGGSAGSILSWVQYHSNRELTDLVAKGKGKMPAAKLTDAENSALMTDLRKLAGTNPQMATGGFVLERAGGGGGGAGKGGGRGDAAPAAAAVPLPVQAAQASPNRAGQQATIQLIDGKTTLTGKILSDYMNAATIMTADGKIHLLYREGNTYSEKKIEPKADWTTYHGTVGGNRYSTLNQINSSNVSNLKPLWSLPLKQPRLEATPLVVDGILYVSAWNEIHAVDATTGQELWSYSEPHTPGISSDAGSGAHRGPAISGDRVFLMTDRANLIAFDRKVGTKLWEAELGKVEDAVSASGAPMIVGNLVIAGIAGGEEGVRGFLDAYDVATGKRAWRFYTIPARGEPGSETWVGAALEHGCGATWLTGSYDPALDTLYWPVGNPCPDMNGAERIGDNLWTNSIVALNPKTGKMKWYYQFTPHDTHDWDAVQPMLLVDADYQGRPRKMIMNANRNGMFYLLDRTNGQFLMATNFATKVTWNTGYTKEGKPLLTKTFITTPEGVATCPAVTGGSTWHAAAYSPETKLFYARVSDSCAIYQAHSDPLNGSNRWFGRGSGPSAEATKGLADLRADYSGGSFLRAFDPVTGKKVWDFAGGRAGVLATAGNILLIGAQGGGLAALDAKTGKLLYTADNGQNTSSTAMTYMVGGKQYIALNGSNALVVYAIPGN